MNFDIRIAIGALFGILGLILTVYGLFTISNPTMYAKSLNINFNLIWGIVMMLFSSVMLFLARKSFKAKK